MQFVQTLLTTDQTSKVEQALKLVLDRADDLGIVWNDENEQNEYAQLAGFFQAVTENPTKFAPRGEMARTVKQIYRRVKGPAQPKSAAPKRSQGQQKRDRKLRRELAAEYNAARERVEKDMEEARDAHLEQLKEQQLRVSDLVSSDVLMRAQLIELLELIGADGLANQARTLAKESGHVWEVQ